MPTISAAGTQDWKPTGMARTSAGGDVRTNVKRMFVEYVQQHCDSKHNGVEKTYE